jgi:hypothetical protein
MTSSSKATRETDHRSSSIANILPTTSRATNGERHASIGSLKQLVSNGLCAVGTQNNGVNGLVTMRRTGNVGDALVKMESSCMARARLWDVARVCERARSPNIFASPIYLEFEVRSSTFSAKFL